MNREQQTPCDKPSGILSGYRCKLPNGHNSPHLYAHAEDATPPAPPLTEAQAQALARVDLAGVNHAQPAPPAEPMGGLSLPRALAAAYAQKELAPNERPACQTHGQMSLVEGPFLVEDRLGRAWLCPSCVAAFYPVAHPPALGDEGARLKVERPNYDELDPGIRDIVRMLNDHGFDTTDSGDGVSKPTDWYASGCALPFPNVAMTSTPATMVADAERAAVLLGDDWTVEASYSSLDKKCFLLARTLDPREVRGTTTTPGAT